MGVPSEDRLWRRRQEILELVGEAPTPFSELERRAEELGIGSGTLGRHLRALTQEGLIERLVDSTSFPPRVSYRRIPAQSLLQALSTGSTETPPLGPAPSGPEAEAWLRAQIHSLKYRLLIRLLMAVFGEADTEEEWQRSLQPAPEGEIPKLIMPPGENGRRLVKMFYQTVFQLKQLPREVRDRVLFRTLILEAVKEKEETESLPHVGAEKKED